MNDESRRKSRIEALKALVFEFCSLLLQATVPSSPVEKSIRIWESVLGRHARTFLNYGPRRKKGKIWLLLRLGTE